MPARVVVRATVDEQTKREAAAVLATMGLTVSEAIRILMARVARDKAMPFEVGKEHTADAARAGGRYSLEDVRAALWPTTLTHRSEEETRKKIKERVKANHMRRA